MGISSINNNRFGGRVLSNSQINSLISNGLTLKLINDYIALGYSYNQMISAWQSEKALGYIAKFGGTLSNAITALTGLTASSYAAANGFTVEGFGGNSYLKKDFLSGTTSWTTPSILEGYSSIALVVAGGGSGGWDVGGGGGAGGVIYNQNFTTSGTLAVTVGAGGVGSSSGHPVIGGSGANSIFGSLTAIGGGAGGNYNGGIGQPGGSGGGGSGWTNGYAGGAGTTGQGYAGGNGFGGGSGSGGGGGGAAGPGTNASGSGTYAGGAGVSIFGTTYGVGGTGVNDSTGVSNAAANTGNGGSGAGNPNVGGSGGSGIIIVRYQL